jgi:lipopolysaccharide transport system ATP-binding protein
MNPVIKAEGLGKLYRLGERRRHDTMRDAVIDRAASPIRWLRSAFNGGSSSPEIWALDGVTFEIMPGEVVGLIGPNGAGKSTLLKILSRITEPTTGMVDLYGRVGSLLEVGTGFHPELTGRDNIYLSGAILGMRKAEIRSKFDDIVAFAEVEKFIDTPVKRYSSGMYVRLAFSVAAHLEPEILLVDEVLAVGDAAFQKRCLGKMDEVAKAGRTVLFVSHNMSAIGRLCPISICLDRGRIVHSGDTRSVIARYLASGDDTTSREWPELDSAPGDELIRVRSVRLLGSDSQPLGVLHQDDPFVVALEYQVLKPMMNANVGFELKADDGAVVFSSFDADNPEWSGRGREPGLYATECVIPAHLLNEGAYHLSLLAGVPFFKLCLRLEDVLTINVAPPVTDVGPSGRMGARRTGVVAPALAWQVTFQGPTAHKRDERIQG